MSDNTEEYPVGYKKPPLHTRFQKGRSGNPSGRPRGLRSVEDLAGKIALEKVSVKENGRRRKMPKVEVMLRRIFNKAMEGDIRCANRIIDWVRQRQTDASERSITKEPISYTSEELKSFSLEELSCIYDEAVRKGCPTDDLRTPRLRRRA
jgi:hypothetical protein